MGTLHQEKELRSASEMLHGCPEAAAPQVTITAPGSAQHSAAASLTGRVPASTSGSRRPTPVLSASCQPKPPPRLPRKPAGTPEPFISDPQQALPTGHFQPLLLRASCCPRCPVSPTETRAPTRNLCDLKTKPRIKGTQGAACRSVRESWCSGLGGDRPPDGRSRASCPVPISTLRSDSLIE